MNPASPNTSPTRQEGLPEHTRPNASRLEPFRAEVALARQRNWPFRAIAEMLQDRHGLTISPRAICGFCQCRGIEKGIGETRSTPAPESSAASPQTASVSASAPLEPRPRRKKKPFIYTEGPLRTRANGLLKDE